MYLTGGKSSFSLGWDDGSQNQQNKPAYKSQSPFATDEEEKKDQTSVKVHYAPGGKSSICLGTDESEFSTSSNSANQAMQQSQAETDTQ